MRSLIKRSLPQQAVEALRPLGNLTRTLEKRKAQRIFVDATDSPAFLDIDTLTRLQSAYPRRPECSYDAHARENTGMARASQLLRLPGASEATTFLELGCWDGMVSCGLMRKGKQATAVDYRDIGFDDRASREGVTFLQMDATALQLADESFDFIFSYNAFEHFRSPDNVLDEAIRVVRTGGYIYLEFGPLYYSPLGEHAYRSITVPYCQFLFPKNVLNDFTSRHGLIPIDFSHVNGWSIEDYRELWNTRDSVLNKVRYRETVDLSHLNLISSYPSCFKSKSSYFDNFLVSNICALFQKKS